ncbi:hypothetical protein OSTOST_02021 [Ostertagia ostertagi]
MNFDSDGEALDPHLFTRTWCRPVPSVEWLDNNGQPISDSERFEIQNVGLSTVLTIRRLRIEDRGEFKLRIRNRCGQDTFPIGIQTARKAEKVWARDLIAISVVVENF